MNPQVIHNERNSGWILAAALGLHLLLPGPAPAFQLATLAILVTGAAMRGQGLFVPRWLGAIVPLAGVVVVIAAQQRFRPGATAAELAGITGALILLRPVTPARGMWVLLCLLLMLTGAILNPYQNVGALIVVIDVIALLIVAEQIHRPPEAQVNIWLAIARAMRVVIPVGIVVTAIFWFFPRLSDYTPPALTGFAGDGILNPGNIAELVESRGVALTAHFDDEYPRPAPADLYWRGRVLEINLGLAWSQSTKRVERERVLQGTPPQISGGLRRYTQDLTPARGGAVPALDHAIFVDAARDGTGVAVLDTGAGALTAVGSGPLSMEVVFAPGGIPDTPTGQIAQGATAVPGNIRKNETIRRVAEGIANAGPDLTARLAKASEFFRDGGFVYTTRPGRSTDLEIFLLRNKRGFCEHYAAAAANLLRLAGIPSRVVTGYRGGSWNPWLRTVTVRNSNAHAWVEAWDATTRRWIRYDPTDAVSPELAGRIAQEMDAANWSLTKRAWTYATAVVTTATTWISTTLGRATTSEVWEQIQFTLFIIIVLLALFWLIRNLPSARSTTPEESASRLLARLAVQAARSPRVRLPGETPLEWLARMETVADDAAEKRAIRSFAAGYGQTLYSPSGGSREVISNLRAAARVIRIAWRNRK